VCHRNGAGVQPETAIRPSPSQTELTSTTSIFRHDDREMRCRLPWCSAAADNRSDRARSLQLEKYEGMRTQVNALAVVARPTRGSVKRSQTPPGTSAGIFYGVIPGNRARPIP